MDEHHRFLGGSRCLAARDHGLDIAGTFFRASGEPVTVAKIRSYDKLDIS